MYYAFGKAKHAVAKDLSKIVRTVHGRKLALAPDSWQKPAKSVLSAKACNSVLVMQNAARESPNASHESVAKGTCERRVR